MRPVPRRDSASIVTGRPPRRARLARAAPAIGRSPGAARARRKFLRFFPDAFEDETYLDWERDYKRETHERWQRVLGRVEFERLLTLGEHDEIAARALRVEQQSRHSMIFSFEKMALRDAVKSRDGARQFADGLHSFLHGGGSLQHRFEAWVECVAALPRRQTRVLTWPAVTVFGFIAQPDTHLFLKPVVSRRAALAYGFDLRYRSKPSWETYARFLEFARVIRRDLRDLRPRDMIDLQSFIWVQGSDEYD
jgi:hypothetical protein